MTKDPGRLKPAAHVLFQELDGEMVLLNLDTEHYYGLDDVGARFWQLLTEHGGVDIAVARMQDEFAVDEPTLRSDLTSLVASLSTAGLLVSQSDV